MMKRIILILILTILILLAILLISFSIVFWFELNKEVNEPMLTFEKEETRPLYVPDEVIVEFKPEISEQEIQVFLKEYNLTANEEEQFSEDFKRDIGNFWVLKIPEGKTVPDVIKLLEDKNLIESAEPNYYVYFDMIPNDMYYHNQWHLKQINMEKVWNISKGGSPNVIVAILDTGVAYENYPVPHWHTSTYNAYGGKGYSWWCGSADPFEVGFAPGYGNNWDDELKQFIDLTGVNGKITLTYKYRYDLDESGDDFSKTDVFLDKHEEFSPIIKSRHKIYRGNSNGWRTESIDISIFAGDKIWIVFSVETDKKNSDEDGGYDSDGAFFIDEIEIKAETEEDVWDSVFYDDVESGLLGLGSGWEVLKFKKAPDLAGTNFWTNPGEIPNDGIDNDNNGYIDDINGWDFSYNNNHPNDYMGHGTHIAGIIAQTTNNISGAAGIAYDVTIMPIKLPNYSGSAFDSALIKGIYYAVKNGAKIINMSVYAPFSNIKEKTLKYAFDKGVVLVSASGNDYDLSICDYPARANKYVIAVGAVERNKSILVKADYSNSCFELDLTAPGTNILQQSFNEGHPTKFDYIYESGTSFSAPHIVGVAALLLSVNPNLTPLQIKYILESTAEDLGEPGWDKYYGCGLIDAYKALTDGLDNLGNMPDDFDFTKHGCSYCGNGIIEGGEECDEGDNPFDDFEGNSNTRKDACRMNCKKAHCGDGVKDTGEQCDDGNNINGDGCSSSCKKETRCGNSIKEGIEQCDDGNTNNYDSCRNNCKLPYCGDGIIDSGEECDGGTACDIFCNKIEKVEENKGACIYFYDTHCLDYSAFYMSTYNYNYEKVAAECVGIGGGPGKFYLGKSCVDLGYGVCYCPGCIGTNMILFGQTTREHCESLSVCGKCEYYPNKSIKDSPWLSE